MIKEAIKGAQSMTPDWRRTASLPDGVKVKQVRNIVTANGITTEAYRANWEESHTGARHIILEKSFHRRGRRERRGKSIEYGLTTDHPTDECMSSHNSLSFRIFCVLRGSELRFSG